MSNTPTQTALVTGATSGLGFEAAAQLGDAAYGRVIITGRTPERARDAADRLSERVGRNVFEAVALDLNDAASIDHAAEAIHTMGGAIDLVVLNAGMVAGNTLRRTAAEIEVTFSSSLIGHHRLTMRLLETGGLSPQADIVIAGSEAARGDMPTMNVTDLGDLAERGFEGDLSAAAEALIRQNGPVQYKPSNAYADAKVFVAWWAASLARRLPAGMTVNAVSPGSAPGTDAARNAEGFLKYVMLPVFKLAPKFMGMSHSVADGASRYLEVASYDGVSGEFFASAPKKVTGPLHVMQHPHFKNDVHQEAAWQATVNVAGGIDIPDGAASSEH